MNAGCPDPITFLESKFSITFKRECRDEYSSPCPWCGGRDRFRVWRDAGNYWCRPGPAHCGRSGWVDELAGIRISDEERRLRKIEARQRELERQQAEQEERLTKLELLSKNRPDLAYHNNLDMEALEYWWGEGMTNESIAKFRLGFCARCPTDYEGRPSYTIPVWGVDGETLLNVRHRISGAKEDKYRPQMAGLGTQLFNSHTMTVEQNEVVLTEGAKKAIVLDQHDFSSVAIMGHRAFMSEWLEMFNGHAVHIALDPDAHDSAYKLGHFFAEAGKDVKVVSLPTKADDFFVKYGGNADSFRSFLDLGRPIN
jgi:hypothetical protein